MLVLVICRGIESTCNRDLQCWCLSFAEVSCAGRWGLNSSKNLNCEFESSFANGYQKG